MINPKAKYHQFAMNDYAKVNTMDLMYNEFCISLNHILSMFNSNISIKDIFKILIFIILIPIIPYAWYSNVKKTKMRFKENTSTIYQHNFEAFFEYSKYNFDSKPHSWY